MADTLDVGDVFLSITPELSGDDPHFHIVVYKTSEDDILVVYTTKEVEKVKARCRKKEGIKFDYIEPDTLVVINNSHCSTFTLESAIDCNKAVLKSVEYFTGKLYFKKLSPIKDSNVIVLIKNGIKKSPLIPDAIKNLL